MVLATGEPDHPGEGEPHPVDGQHAEEVDTMAIGGDEANILWFAPRGHDLAIPAPQAGNYQESGVKSAVVGTPIFGHDVNVDGTPDVIATLIDAGASPQRDRQQLITRTWVEAICAKTGNTLWTYEIPPAWFQPAEFAET